MNAAVRHALVTGGGQGIGAAVVHALRSQGMNVTVLGRRLDVLQAMVASDTAHLHAVTADVADPAQVECAVASARERFGPMQILVNNAGQALSAPFHKMEMALWNQMIAVNLTGVMVCSRAVLPDLLEAGWGRIVNISSTAGQVGYAYVSAYCAAKHGVIGLTRSLALELATCGITVNAVCPGYTETHIMRESIERVVAKTGRTPEQAAAEFVKSNPQGRLVQPQQVADAVAWLCGAGAAAVTGQSISVSGGEVM